MKFRILFSILIAVFFLWACVPKQAVRVGVASGDELFLRAEKLFQEKIYGKALDAYNEYLARFPEGPRAAAAVFKIGAVYGALGNYAEARVKYDRLITEYPDSPLVPDAAIEILVTLYHEGKYNDVIRKAQDLLKQSLSREHIFRLYVLIGDSYTARGAPSDAVFYYSLAYQNMEDQERERLIPKLKTAISQLGLSDITTLLRYQEDPLLIGYLLRQLGLLHMTEAKYDDAEKAFSEFIDRFPDHENIEEVKSLLRELYQNYLYRRYTLGCLLPLSGPYKIYGHRALKGIELALKEFSSRNSGSPIQIIIKDTESDPEKSALAMRELAQAQVAAVIGPIITAEIAAVEAQNRGIPIITLTQKDNIVNTGDFVFRNFLTPRMQVKAILAYAVEELGLKRFAILYPDERYGITFMNLFWDEVIAYGGSVVGAESYRLIQTDFIDPIKKIVGLYYEIPEDLKVTSPQNSTRKLDNQKDNTEEPEAIVDFDAIFIPDSPKKAGLIIPQLAFYDVEDVYLFGTNLWHSERLVQMAREYVQGAIMADGFFVDSPLEAVQKFVEDFQETYQEKPGFIEAVTYDTAMILFQVVNQTHVQTRLAIKDELMNLGNYQGATGFTSFDTNGEVRKKLYILKINGDNFVEVGRKGIRKPSGLIFSDG
jgi:ABC-type branched-subunit amino acid transport system substrate-binding protein